MAQTVACSEVGTATIAETLVEDNGVNDAYGTNFRPVDFIELYAGNLQGPANLGIGDYSHYYATDYINQLNSGSTAGGVMNIGANYSDAVANGGFAGPSEAYTAGTRFSLASIPAGTPMTLRFMHGFEQPQAVMNFSANGTGSVQLCVTWGRSGLGSLDTTSVVQGACPAPI